MEITANAIQTVATNSDVLFTDTIVPGCASIIHRGGSGLVTLRGLANNQCRARFRVSFSGNIAIPTGGTAPAAATLAIALSGEALPASTMISTPAAVEQYNSISTSIFIDIPTGCCAQISVKNIGAEAVEVQNANLIVERVA